jgi:cob(I)alamin adenosyltransferase
MARISTGTGDKGETSLFDLSRVPKDSLRVEAYGHVDELNSVLGLTVSAAREAGGRRGGLLKQLSTLQNHLFLLGADLATPLEKEQPNRISDEEIGWVEAFEEELEDSLPTLKHFILPGGSMVAALLHQSRAVARRAERAVARLSREEKVNPLALVYLNRLSDLLFLMARNENRVAGAKEVPVEFRAPRRKGK